MIRDPEKITLLIAQLEKEYTAIEENIELNRKALIRIEEGADDVLDWAALGYTLHILYTAMENYFLRISKFFENELERESWHKELVDKMQLDLPGIRPALFDRKSAAVINELRAFRHVFRTYYDERLDEERIKLIQEKVPRVKNIIEEAHREFIRNLAEQV